MMYRGSMVETISEEMSEKKLVRPRKITLRSTERHVREGSSPCWRGGYVFLNLLFDTLDSISDCDHLLKLGGY